MTFVGQTGVKRLMPYSSTSDKLRKVILFNFSIYFILLAFSLQHSKNAPYMNYGGHLILSLISFL